MTSAIGAISGTWAAVPAQSTSTSAALDNVMSAVSGELGITQTQLQSQLQSGQSLSQIASAAGVSSDQLNATITSALQQSNLPPGTDVSSVATKMATHVGGHHHHHGGGTPAPSASTPSASSSTPATSALNGSSSTSGIYL